jgi:selenide, water dikinase
MPTSFMKREVVLWGMGHTNLHVLRRWRVEPIPNTRLTCVSDSPISTYSGMLPGVLAGQYPRERMEINLVRLCDSTGARLIPGDVTGLDLARRQLMLEDSPPLRFDVLAIGIGSVPSREGLEELGDVVLAVKPMPTFLDRLRERLLSLGPRVAGRALRAAVVGGGAGGVEIAFCLPPFVSRTLGDVALELSLIHAGAHLAVGSLATNDLVRRRLDSRGVRLLLGRRVTRVEQDLVTLVTGKHVEADVIIWATSATAPPILGRLGLPTDERGFLLTRPTLQTLADAPIFAVGDSGTIQEFPTPKAGVYAVRQGPVVWRNITRMLDGRPPRPYRPQKSFLRLINTGDGRAIGEHVGFTFEGRWCWWLKDWIDRRFMDQFRCPGGAG